VLQNAKTLLVIGWATALLLFIGSHRLVAGDEGFYTLAIRLVSDGKIPYSDFFYPQMPLLPYFHSMIAFLIGSATWESLRLMSSLCAALTVGLTFCFLQSYTNWFIAACCLIILTVSPLFFPWIVTIETYSLTAPLLLISVLITEKLRQASLIKKIIDYDHFLVCLVGASLSLASQTRLYSVALLPIIFFYTPRKLKLWLFISFTLFCVPSLILFLLDPNLFWFNNLGYHLSRAHAPLWHQVQAKFQILLVLLGLVPSNKFVGYNTAILFWGGVIGAFCYVRSLPVIALSSLTLCVISFLPTPSYFQYFALVSPLWAILCGVHMTRIVASSFGVRFRLSLLFPIGIVIVSLIGFDTNFRKYLLNGDGVMGIPKSSNANDFTLSSTQKVSDRINAYFGPSDVLFSNWNGYLLGASATPFTGSENIFGIRTAERFPKISDKLQIASYEAILDAIKKSKISGVIIRNQFARTKTKFSRVIRNEHCTMVEEINGVTIFDCRKSRSNVILSETL